MRSSKQGIKSTRFSLKDGIYKGKTKGLDFYKHYFVEYPSSLGEKQLQIVRWGERKTGFPALQVVKCLHILLKRETCHDDIRIRKGLMVLTMTLRPLNVQ